VTPERFAALKRLFVAVAELPPGERATRLRQLTGDEELAAEVLALFAAGTGSTGLSAPIAAALASAAVRPPAEGDVLGVWRLAGEIGQGGMGSVFLAERHDGHFRQRAAVKFLRGLPHPEVLALFTRERQLLASLTHPNIARLLDGGATPQGQPYLVMEYVEGCHIDEHCRRGGLGVRAILVLFLTACNAVASAHHQMVIHCDLKPSNLLVDGHGRPVLLDFGIARLAEQVGADGAGEGPGEERKEESSPPGFTPRYASPEQRAHARVTTASDVYSLGVLLGELLEGASDHGRLPALRRRELAAIVERARREDPAERYSTVDALTADVRSFLDQRPVQALAGTAGYGLRKGLARHRSWVAMAAALALLGAGFTYKVVAESRRARAAEQSAREAEASSRQVSEFLVSIFEGSNPGQEIVEIPTSKLVAQAEAKIERELASHPATLSDVSFALARVQTNIGHPDQALAHYQRAIDIERRQNRPLVLARLLAGRGALRLARQGAVAAEADFRETLALRERYAGVEAEETVEARNNLAGALSSASRYREAVALFQQNVRIAERYGFRAQLAKALGWLGDSYSRQRLHAKALPALRRGAALQASVSGEVSGEALIMLEWLGQALMRARQVEEAERVFRRIVAGRRQLDGPDSTDTAAATASLARMLESSGRSLQALPLYREALAVIARKQGEDSPLYGVLVYNAAKATASAGDVDAAGPMYARALSVLEKLWDAKSLAPMRRNVGLFLLRTGKREAARTQIVAALDAQTAAGEEDKADVAVTRIALAQWHVEAGEPEEALRQLVQAEPAIPAEDAELRAKIDRQYARLHALQGRRDDALRGLEEVERAEKRLWGERDSRYLLGRLDRAELLARGTPEQRAEGAALAAEILTRVRPLLVADAPVLARLAKLAQLTRKP
jgi:serine/threonine-protein kinase